MNSTTEVTESISSLEEVLKFRCNGQEIPKQEFAGHMTHFPSELVTPFDVDMNDGNMTITPPVDSRHAWYGNFNYGPNTVEYGYVVH